VLMASDSGRMSSPVGGPADATSKGLIALVRTFALGLVDAGLLDRYVQSSKMVYAALLLLMLEAVHTDLVSPSA
jgi:hypothetical protein